MAGIMDIGALLDPQVMASAAQPQQADPGLRDQVGTIPQRIR